MKLNYKRTIFVGFAFFLICTFWQAYDTIIPKILVDQFGMSQAGSGVVMALDNILALFMLPRDIRPLHKPARPSNALHYYWYDRRFRDARCSVLCGQQTAFQHCGRFRH